jgi:hypothetical protein
MSDQKTAEQHPRKPWNPHEGGDREKGASRVWKKAAGLSEEAMNLALDKLEKVHEAKNGTADVILRGAHLVSEIAKGSSFAKVKHRAEALLRRWEKEGHIRPNHSP